MELLCECNSFGCIAKIEVSTEEATKIYNAGLIPIVNGCPTGPDASDELVEDCKGYSLYRGEI
jgi:hypothetical protein